MPWKPRHIQKDDIEKFIEKHSWITPPSLENVEMVMMTVDTMDDFYSWGIFAFDVNDNSYLIDCGETPYLELLDEKRKQLNEERQNDGKPPVVTIDDLLSKDWLVNDGIGTKPLMCCIDVRWTQSRRSKAFR